MDVNRHLNNVSIAALIEDSRVRFNDVVGMREKLGALTAMNVSLSIDYLAQAYYPQPVRGLVAVEAQGRTSWTVVQLLLQNGEVTAFSRSVLVCVDRGVPAPLPEPLRAAYAAMMLG
jgi:acyl-CoA thioester hydrolase